MILSLLIDALVFIVAPYLAWRLSGRAVPFAIIPIFVGICLAFFSHHSTIPQLFLSPSPVGDLLGWLGVILLAFSAGLESQEIDFSRKRKEEKAGSGVSNRQVLRCAALALFMPFIVGVLAAISLSAAFSSWQPPNGLILLASLGFGVCMAVSALPLMAAIVNELPQEHKSMGRLAIRIAVINDAILWLGLAVVIGLAQARTDIEWSLIETLALSTFMGLMILRQWSQRLDLHIPTWMAWPLAALILAAGSWAIGVFGLHHLLGAYFAGAAMPRFIEKRLPAERIGFIAMIAMAPFFFGYQGMRVEGGVLDLFTVGTALGLCVLAAAAKMLAVYIIPPSTNFTRGESLAAGTLLQCKGLMEIVAATMLLDAALLTETAFATLIIMAIVSTAVTPPLFRYFIRMHLHLLVLKEERA